MSDDEVDPAVLLIASANAYHLAEVVGADQDPARGVLQDFVNAFHGRYLTRLVELTRAGVGFGVEVAGSMYDDDLEPGDEPFEGVLVTAYFRAESVVMSRAAFARLVDAIVAWSEKRR